MSDFLAGVFGLIDHTISAMLTIPVFALIFGFFVFMAVFGIFLYAKDSLSGRRNRYDK